MISSRLSAAQFGKAEDVANEIKQYRAASKNKDLKVIVGGLITQQGSTVLRSIGADAIIGDARQAPEIAQNLLAEHGANC